MSYFGNLYNENELPPRAKALYMYLRDRTGKNGECWPAIKTIARDTSMSVSTVKRAMNDLVKHGLLTKERRTRENNGDTSNLYKLKL